MGKFFVEKQVSALQGRIEKFVSNSPTGDTTLIEITDSPAFQDVTTSMVASAINDMLKSGKLRAEGVLLRK